MRKTGLFFTVLLSIIILSSTMILSEPVFADKDDNKEKKDKEVKEKDSKNDNNPFEAIWAALDNLQEQINNLSFIQTDPDKPIVVLHVDPNSNVPALIVEDENNQPLFTVNEDGSIKIGTHSVTINPDGTVIGAPLNIPIGSTVEGDLIATNSDISAIELTPGPSGENGINCWDLNENGSADFPDEDVNGDSSINVLDCQGPPGADGPPGPPGTSSGAGEFKLFKWNFDSSNFESNPILYFPIRQESTVFFHVNSPTLGIGALGLRVYDDSGIMLLNAFNSVNHPGFFPNLEINKILDLDEGDYSMVVELNTSGCSDLNPCQVYLQVYPKIIPEN